jgi:gamma-glutamylcyclotransferase (GGCT)/AIG2-like uncharacterized protein YtfP
MRQLKYELTSGYMVGLRVEYPVIRTVEGKVVGMCLDADSPYLHAMVASPEMLEALKALIAYQADNETEYLGMQQIVAYQRAKAAIAKAEGREHE